MAFKNILVTGANGMLGRELVPYLSSRGYEVTPSTSEHINLLGTQADMQEQLELAAPEVIIHAAAYTNVDQAEHEPDLAMAINKDGTRKLALAAKEIGAIFIYVSTDFVFDGLKGEPYAPEDRPNPINMYGLSKYYGELLVSELLEEYYIVRTSWLYGIHKKNFVQFVLDTARSGQEVRIVTDQIGTPSWVGTLSVALENIMNSGRYGTFHASDAGVISRYDQALEMCRMMGLGTDHIVPTTSDELRQIAPRPRYSPLDCGDLPIPTWQTAFQAYLEQYKYRYHVA